MIVGFEGFCDEDRYHTRNCKDLTGRSLESGNQLATSDNMYSPSLQGAASRIGFLPRANKPSLRSYEILSSDFCRATLRCTDREGTGLSHVFPFSHSDSDGIIAYPN